MELKDFSKTSQLTTKLHCITSQNSTDSICQAETLKYNYFKTHKNMEKSMFGIKCVFTFP